MSAVKVAVPEFSANATLPVVDKIGELARGIRSIARLVDEALRHDYLDEECRDVMDVLAHLSTEIATRAQDIGCQLETLERAQEQCDAQAAGVRR